MKCTILHESRGRMRVHVNAVRMTLHRADVLEAYLNHSEVIEHAKVYERTGDVLITYKGSRAGAVTVLSHYKFDNPELDSLVTSADSRKINQEYQERFVNLVVFRAFHKLFLPAPVRAVITVFKAIEFICHGLVCLWHRKLEVEVLDALSIGVSLLRGDFNTAGSVMFLLNVGALLEEWTRKKSLDDLARSMSLNVDRVWVRSQGTEVLMPITKVKAGDEIIVRSGNMVPLDGTVIEGEAMVNQAALTGESMPVRKIAGATVYAGTVVEEGECVFAANAVDGASRYDKIVSMIEESEKLKSGTENHALELADRLVPFQELPLPDEEVRGAVVIQPLLVQLSELSGKGADAVTALLAERAAMQEGVLAADGDVGQILALCEGTRADLRHAGGNVDLLQVVVVVKRIFADGFQALRQDDLAQLKVGLR